MEGDAKGQVGGLDMSETERERLARESRGWKCKGCGGRSNEAILQEEGEKALDADGAGAGAGAGEQKVPEELRFGFKDQMKSPGEKLDKGKQKEEIVSPVVDARTEQPHPPQQEARREVVQSVAAPAGPALALHAPTRTTTAGNQRVSQDDVPAWIDKAITGVAAALALLVIKKMLV